MIAALLIISAFLLGSVSFGDIISKTKGIDLKKVGSGNIGTTNVLRSMGKGAAIFTLAGDLLKGTVAVAAAHSLLNDVLLEGLVGLAAIAGHNYSVFLRFRGGKGVATSIGVLLAYSPAVALITVALWLAVAAISRYSSLGALVSFAVLPFTMYLIDHSTEKVVVAMIITTLLMVKHRTNIGKLLQGTERKIGEKA